MDLTLSSITIQLLHAHSLTPPKKPQPQQPIAQPQPFPPMPSQSVNRLSPPLIVNVADPESSPPFQLQAHTRPCTQQANPFGGRPDTPLDFCNPKTSAIKGKAPLLELRAPPTKQALRASTDQGRPVVDPAIKGIPQGWEDDPAMPLAPYSQPQPQNDRPSSPPSHSRIASHFTKQKPFNDARVKLSSFSGMVKEGWRERERDASKGSSVLKLQRAQSRSNPNPASTLSIKQIHTPSRSVHSESSFMTQTTSDAGVLILPPSALTETTESTDPELSNSFASLFTPSPGANDIYPASVRSANSGSIRDRVLGIRPDPHPHVPAAQSKVFLPPHVSDALPFAAGHPFAAWSVPAEEDSQVSSDKGARGRRPSLPFATLSPDAVEETQEGWKEAIRRTGLPAKKVWIDAAGEEVGAAYTVGWERDVLDLEARLHETMYEVAGDRHTFTEYDSPPATVLDIGTGTGLWPISQALVWPETTFVGLDLVPCQTDLTLLADAERMARSTSAGTARGVGMWESIERRILWQKGNFLTELPFDTGVFDVVHIRFAGLGIPESKWGDIIEEAIRVMKRGGKLEIVEMSYVLPTSSSLSLKNSFASLLLSNMIQPLPLLPLRFNLPSAENLVAKGSLIKPLFEKNYKVSNAPGALKDAVLVWVRSALEYKGTSLVRNDNGVNGILYDVKKELGAADRKKWVFEKDDKEAKLPEGEVSIWAWVATKR